MTVADICENKRAFKDRVYKDMHTYHMFRLNMKRAEKESGMTEEQNMHLLIRKYEEAVAQPYKLRANK